MINESIESLLLYGLKKHLFEKDDVELMRNNLLYKLGLEDYDLSSKGEDKPLNEILKDICDYAVKQHLIDDTIDSRDLFDSQVMGLLTPRPSDVFKNFLMQYQKRPEAATSYFYELSQNTNYIRTDRSVKDVRWVTKTIYGNLDISINLSKPEKDPRDIAKAKSAPQAGYPKCALCVDSVGYAGRSNFPGRANHRIIPLVLNKESWALQYSPYVYYNEHCIVLDKEHRPMTIDRGTFVRMFDFIKKFPHYFVGSNADLPIVGGSILSHEHFQGGKYHFAIEDAKELIGFKLKDYPNIQASVINWPMSTIRLKSKTAEELVNASEIILNKWKSYTDEEANIIAFTGKENTPHNTITPIARFKNGFYEIDLVLRNNLTSDIYPLGIYHPHPEYHHIKKENIGLIEVMGLAILPGRLKDELYTIKDYLLGKTSFIQDRIIKHETWINKMKDKYRFDESNVDEILREEIGTIYMHILENAGVFFKKNDAFKRFVETL